MPLIPGVTTQILSRKDSVLIHDPDKVGIPGTTRPRN